MVFVFVSNFERDKYGISCFPSGGTSTMTTCYILGHAEQKGRIQTLPAYNAFKRTNSWLQLSALIRFSSMPHCKLFLITSLI